MTFTIAFAPRSSDDSCPWLAIGFDPECCTLSSRWHTEAEVIEALRTAIPRVCDLAILCPIPVNEAH